MRHFFQAFIASRVTLRNLFRPVLTVQYPKVIRPRSERFRASFALTHDEHKEENCIACKLCQLICPSDIIVVTSAEKRESPITGKKRGYLTDFTLDSNACIYCELCVQVCPTDAIVMVRSAEQAAFAREDLVLTMDKLYANEHLKQPTWATGTKLCDMQDPNRPDPNAAVAAPVAAPVPAAAPAAVPVPAAAPVATPAAVAPVVTEVA